MRRRRSRTHSGPNKRTKLAACEVRVAYIQVNNAYPIADYGDVKEWTRDRATPNASCIQMGTKLTFQIGLSATLRSGGPHNGLTFSCRAEIRHRWLGGQAAVETLQDDNVNIAATGDITCVLTTAAVLHAGITRSTVKLSAFRLTGAPSVALDSVSPLTFEVYTIFGPPLDDNVKESHLVAVLPNNADKTYVKRILPFFSVAHLESACKWAKGEASLTPQGVVQTIVRSIPQITYGENDDYHENNDGWNVWDNPDGRTGDCSQQASFFADVLGTLGIRGRDYEIKCEATDSQGRKYWRSFGDAPHWPTHGVLLVNYQNGGMYCHDTTFTTPRKTVTLEKAIKVGPSHFIDHWHEWWRLNTNGTPSGAAVGQQVVQWLDTNRGQAWWQAEMRKKAQRLFPDSERQ